MAALCDQPVCGLLPVCGVLCAGPGPSSPRRAARRDAAGHFFNDASSVESARAWATEREAHAELFTRRGVFARRTTRAARVGEREVQSARVFFYEPSRDGGTGRGAAAAATRRVRADEERRRRGRDAESPWRRRAAPPRPRRGWSVEDGSRRRRGRDADSPCRTGRGDAAATTWHSVEPPRLRRGIRSRRRRGYDVAFGRDAAAATTWHSVETPPRLRRGIRTSRRGYDVDIRTSRRGYDVDIRTRRRGYDVAFGRDAAAATWIFGRDAAAVTRSRPDSRVRGRRPPICPPQVAAPRRATRARVGGRVCAVPARQRLRGVRRRRQLRDVRAARGAGVDAAPRRRGGRARAARRGRVTVYRYYTGKSN